MLLSFKKKSISKEIEKSSKILSVWNHQDNFLRHKIVKSEKDILGNKMKRWEKGL